MLSEAKHLWLPFHPQFPIVILPNDECGTISPLTVANDNEGKLTNDKLNGGICYVFGVLYPLLYLLSVSCERQQRFLRFHRFQCLFLFALWFPFCT